jgi:hypothetical protein
MSTTPKSAPTKSSGDDRNLVTVDENYLAPSFEDRLRIFWEKNSSSVLAACGLVLVVILAKGGYEIYTAQREKAVAAAYAAATTDDQLKSFIAANPAHVLGGLAQLRLADEAYAAGSYADARAAYEKAAGILKSNTFGERARVGAAVSAVQAGASAEGEAALKQLSSDITLTKLVRAEATYHLASLAGAAGNATEAIRLIEQVTVIDPEGPWVDRASMLRATLPKGATVAVAAPAASEVAPAVSFGK